ncbi:MAG: Rdx family protein [Gemmatimonadetes bacterium]|nr:Rdx family protein [Gemmatimonadota bacterium]
MAVAIRETWPDAEVGMIPSGGGVFEVTLEDRVVYSKRQTGRHARPGEILSLLRALRPET